MELDISEFTYPLPKEQIALYPPQNRGESKLLVWKNGVTSHHTFSHITNQLPQNCTLVFNNTRVIPARILFQKSTGAQIEILLLNPCQTQEPIQQVMTSTANCAWSCKIGNIKRWKTGTNLQKSIGLLTLKATLLDRDAGQVLFHWEPKNTPFSHILEAMGSVPLPPYINRPVASSDHDRYQTVYALHPGGVAAPTAGLHFTQPLIDELHRKGIKSTFVTLHVGSGTFQPIKTKNILDHSMHAEQLIVYKEVIAELLSPGRPIIAVGTTAMRTLESLYWYGVRCLNGEKLDGIIPQQVPYHTRPLPTRQLALQALYNALETKNPLVGQSSIFIVPGYPFQICDGLITNFHMPSSTLILLVAAFVGDAWRAIYSTALAKDYQFLSYGDSSLLLPTPPTRS